MDAFEGAEAVVRVETLQRPIRGSLDLRRSSGEAALVIGAAVFANMFGYVFHFVLSRRLGPDHYGTLVTLMSIAAMLGVVGSSVGTVAMQETAKLWTLHLDSSIAPFLRRTGQFVLRLAALIALGLAIVGLASRSYLHIAEPILWWLLAVLVGFAILTGFARGAAQGAHRFGSFAASLICEGVAKVTIALALVALGLGVAGALGGLIASAVIALFIVLVPTVVGGEHHPWIEGERLRLGGEALKVLAVSTALSALLYIDMLFAKHHFPGEVAGYFGAAGTVARTLPYGVGLVALILMPKAAAARHASRASLAHILALAFGIAILAVAIGFGVIAAFGHVLIALTYGPSYAAAVPMLRIYAIDEGLFALYLLAVSYLVAIARYEVCGYLAAAAACEAVGMAAFGSTPLRLLSVAIVANALLVPIVWTLALRTLRDAQPSRPPSAEGDV